jgi:group I intron endonuclease
MVRRENPNIKYCGIYKITNLEGKCYIGQSTNIERRFLEYFRLERTSIGKKLLKSLETYSPDYHFFEIIEILPLDKNILDKREIFWIEKLNTKNEGLNSTIGGNGIIEHSEESKELLRQARLGKPSPLKGRKGRSFSGRISPNKGNKRSKESIQSQIEKMTGSNQNGRCILNTQNNNIWISATLAGKHYKVSSTTIHNWCKQNKNNLKYG